MNSPYYKRFEVTQEYKGAAHDGLDLVGIDSKEIHATVNGVIHYAGWENPNNHLQGFGLYVCIKGTDNRYYYYGHLSKIKGRIGDSVKITDVIGIEGSTGNSTGSHCHYCIRPQFCKGNAYNVSQISGIPNVLGVYDDGYRLPALTSVTKTTAKTITVEIEFDGKTYAGTLKEKV